MPRTFDHETMPKTLVRLLTRLLITAVVIGIVFALFSVGVAMTTADKCGDLKATKHWEYFPPKWECGNG